MITIRPVVPDDAAALRALALTSPETGSVQARPEFHADAYTATLAPAPGSQGLVACTPQGRVVGQIFWRPVRVLIGGQAIPATHAFFLAVHPDFRRQGIGHRLCLAAREAGRDAGGRLFYGNVQQGNQASINTFRKLGCLPVGRLTRAVVPLRQRPPGQRFGFQMIQSAIHQAEQVQPKYRPGHVEGSEIDPLNGAGVRAAGPEDLSAFTRAVNDFYAEHNFWSPLTVQGLQAWLSPDDNRVRRNLYVAEDTEGKLLAGVAVSDATALRTGVVEHAPWLVRVIGRHLKLIDATGHMRFVSAEAPWYRPGQEATARFLWDWVRWHLRRQATALLIDYDLQGPAARAVTRPKYVPVAHYHIYACPSSPIGSELEIDPLRCEGRGGDFRAAFDLPRFVASGLAVS